MARWIPGSAVVAGALLCGACWVGTEQGPPPATQVTPLPQVQQTSTVPTQPVVIAVAAPDLPFAQGQAWVGRYECAQGITELTVRIGFAQGRTVNGTFAFHHVPTGAAGEYVLAGTFDPTTRELSMEPGAWITRPPNYVTVGMRGVVSTDGLSWSGVITHPSCGAFWVNRAGG